MGPPQNTGSFGAAAGGVSPELMDAIQRRGAQGGAMGAVTQGAPTFNPQTQPAQPPQGQPQQNQQPQPTQQPSLPGQAQQPLLPFDASQANIKIILGALTNKLKSESKIQEMLSGLPPVVGGSNGRTA